MHTEQKEEVTQAIEVKERTVEQKIADAVACCAAVAKLYKRYGGAFVAIPANKTAKPGTKVKGPRNDMRRCFALVKPVSVPRHLFCASCKLPFVGASNYRCQCKASVQNKRRSA